MKDETHTKSAGYSEPGSTSSGRIVELSALLQDLPDREPLFDLTPCVLSKLKPKRPSLRYRLSALVNTPRTVIIRPLRLTSTLALCLLLAFAAYFQSGRWGSAPLQQHEQRLIPLVIRFQAPGAGSVHLIGSFNDWQPAGYAMRRSGSKNQWVIRIQVPPGSYEYAFLIDNNRTVPDPDASFYKSDSFGSRNSVLFADSTDENIL